MTVLLSDSFTRANSTTSPGTPDVGGPYTVGTGTWGISSNQLYTSASTANSQLTFPAAYNLTLQATIAVGGTLSQLGMMFRWVDASNYWWAGVNATGFACLGHSTAGTLGQVSGVGACANGATLKVTAYNEFIYLWVNGVLAAAVEDRFGGTASTAGVRMNSATTLRLDDLYAETLAALPGGLDGTSTTAVYKGRDTATADAGSVA